MGENELRLTQCVCYRVMTCHYCHEQLVEDELNVSDDQAWADYVLHGPVIDLHILAHAYCAEGQDEVERA